MKSQTDKLLERLNALRGVKYPDMGYCFFADIKGDGLGNKAIWQIINENGGVCYATGLNARTPHLRCQLIRAAIVQEESRA